MEWYNPPEGTHMRRPKGSARLVDTVDVKFFLDPEPNTSKTAYSIPARARASRYPPQYARDSGQGYLDNDAERIRAIRAEEEIISTIEHAYTTGIAEGLLEGRLEERNAARRAQDAETAALYRHKHRQTDRRRPYYDRRYKINERDEIRDYPSRRRAPLPGKGRVIYEGGHPRFVPERLVVTDRLHGVVPAHMEPAGYFNPFAPLPPRKYTEFYEREGDDDNWDDAYQSSKRQQRDTEWQARAHIVRGDAFAEDEAVRRREADDEGFQAARAARQRTHIRDLRAEADAMEAELDWPPLRATPALSPRVSGYF